MEFWILKDGIPIAVTEDEWRVWFYNDQGTLKNRLIRHDKIKGKGMVSTVFLGINTSFSKNPRLWETALFESDIGEGDYDIYRSETKEKALEIHESLLKKISL